MAAPQDERRLTIRRKTATGTPNPSQATDACNRFAPFGALTLPPEMKKAKTSRGALSTARSGAIAARSAGTPPPA